MSDPFAMPVAFHFKVTMQGLDPISFQEVSGLETHMEAETIAEGGENRFVHHLPKPQKRGNLTLKRAVSEATDPLVAWCKDTLENNLAKKIETKVLTIELVDQTGTAQAVWQIENAYPVRWSLGGFDAMKNEMSIEAIELAFATLARLK